MRLVRSRGVRTAALALLVGLGAGAAGAQDRPSEEAMRAIEERGRRLAAYREAIASTLARLRERTGEDLQSDVQIVVPKRTGGWHVTLARKAAPGQSSQGFQMVGEADFSDGTGVVDHERVLPEPGAVPAGILPYLKALQIVTGVAANRPEAKPPFVTSIFEEKDRSFTVYLQSDAGEGRVRFGGDYRMKVAAGGQMVVGIDVLHAGITDVPARAAASAQPTLHLHESGDLPTDTDVALVLRNPTLAPHLILTPSSMFRIDANGGITWLGPNQAPAGAAPSRKGAA